MVIDTALEKKAHAKWTLSFINAFDYNFSIMEALKGHVKFLKKVLYLLIRTYASPN